MHGRKGRRVEIHSPSVAAYRIGRLWGRQRSEVREIDAAFLDGLSAHSAGPLARCINHASLSQDRRGDRKR